MKKFIILLFILTISISGCSNKIKIIPRAFNPNFSGTDICNKQGIFSENPQHSICVKFYETQNNKNRRNVFLGFGVALTSVLLFQRECDCFLGPDRGAKFIP
ncbi:hypothetical protein OAK17_04060 [Alphaproteobacteria bacterium]|nr:hypothetical protein [Alphaproteobacteria bacterium]